MTKYPYHSSEIDTHEDATVSPDTYHAPDTHVQQPSTMDVSDSTSAQTEATQANTSTNVNDKEAVSTTEDAPLHNIKQLYNLKPTKKRRQLLKQLKIKHLKLKRKQQQLKIQHS